MSHFNEAAKQWDSADKIERAVAFGNAIRERVSFPRPARVLDIGCGTGLLSFQFRAEARAIVGLDTSSGMLEVFREKAVPGEQAFLLDLEKEELRGQEPFDLIVSSLAFHHLHRPGAMLARLKGLLTPGGKIAVIDLDQEDGSFHADPVKAGVHHAGFSAADCEAWARESGLRLEQRERIFTIEKGGRSYPVILAVLGG